MNTLKNIPLHFVGLSVAVIAIVGAIIFLERPQEAVACTHEGQHLLDLSLIDESGNCNSIADLVSPVTVLNSWASWCPFCVEELPDFATISEEFPEVPIVAINRQETRERATTFLKELGLNDSSIIFLFDPDDSFYRTIEGFAMPETVFVDAKGNTLLHKRGVITLEEMRETLEVLLNRAQPHTSAENDSLCLGGEGGACTTEHII